MAGIPLGITRLELARLGYKSRPARIQMEDGVVEGLEILLADQIFLEAALDDTSGQVFFLRTVSPKVFLGALHVGSTWAEILLAQPTAQIGPGEGTAVTLINGVRLQFCDDRGQQIGDVRVCNIWIYREH